MFFKRAFKVKPIFGYGVLVIMFAQMFLMYPSNPLTPLWSASWWMISLVTVFLWFVLLPAAMYRLNPKLFEEML